MPGDFDVFDGAAHLSFRFREGLAVFLGDEAGEIVDMVFEKHLQLEERLNPVFGRRPAPFRKRGGCGLNGGGDLGSIAERNLGERFARRGIDHLAPFGGARFRPSAVDVVAELGDRRCCNRHD